MLLETGDDEGVALASLWEAIDAVVPHAELRAAVANIEVLTPPLEADAGGGWRAVLVERYPWSAGSCPSCVRRSTHGHRRGRTGPRRPQPASRPAGDPGDETGTRRILRRWPGGR